MHVARTLVVIGLVLASTVAAVGDTRITMEETTVVKIPGNESTTTSEVTLWLRADRAVRLDESGGRMISRLDKGEAWFVNDAEKSYTVIKMDGDSPMTESSSKLEKSGEAKKIGDWTAERYDVVLDLGAGEEPGRGTFWISDDVDVDLAAYRAFVEAAADAAGMDWMKAWVSIDGYPVLQEFEMGIVTVTTRLLSIADETAPAGIYEPPAGYERKE